jgi:hypothetical protein
MPSSISIGRLEEYDEPDNTFCAGCGSKLGFMGANPVVVCFGFETIVCIDCLETASVRAHREETDHAKA